MATMKVFGKSSTISRAYFTPFAPSKYKHAKKKDGRSSYLTNTVYAAVAGDPSIIQLSDGTYKQRSANKRKKKDGTSLQKAFGKLARRKTKSSPSSSSTASADKVLEAVTIQYPGIAPDGGVELDLSFDTTFTIDFSEELGIAEEIESSNIDELQQTPTSLLNRIFPSVFDEEGFIKCLCGPEDPVSLTGTTSTEPIPKKIGSESNDSTTDAATDHQSNGTTSNDASPGTATDVKDSCVPIENMPRMLLAGEANQEASKREADQLALIDLYRSENDRLKQDMERLADLWPRFYAEYEKFKTEAAQLKQEVALLKQEKYEHIMAEAARLKQEMDAEDDPTQTQTTKNAEEGQEDVFGDLKSQLKNDMDRITNIRLDLEKEIAKEQVAFAEEVEVQKMDTSTDSVVGTNYIEEHVFVKVANMFGDDGFIKCV